MGKETQRTFLPAGRMLAVIVAVVLAVAGCNRDETQGDVMAKVNGEKITRADLEKYYQNSIAGSPQQPGGEQATSLRLNILKTLIEEEILGDELPLPVGESG